MLRRIFTLALALILTACGGGGGDPEPAQHVEGEGLAVVTKSAFAGTLHSPPGINYYDFNRLPSLERTHANLASGAAADMTVKFTWGGVAGTAVLEPQHAIAAFVQSTSATGPANALGQITHTHGAGAYVGERGLALETWHRDTPTSPTNGTRWDQFDGRCARDVLGTIPPTAWCLASAEGAGDFITPAPAFQLRRGTVYILRTRVQLVGANTIQIAAWLHTQGIWGAQLVQRGVVHVEGAKHYPAPSLPVHAVVARTPGEATIAYSAP